MDTVRRIVACVHGGRGQGISTSKCGDSSGGYVGHYARPSSLVCGWVYDRSPEGALWRSLAARRACRDVAIELFGGGVAVVRAVVA